MNRIVREHYPVEKLPEDLRAGLPGGSEAMVTLEVSRPGQEVSFSQFRHLAIDRFRSADEAVAHVRALRDEWDD